MVSFYISLRNPRKARFHAFFWLTGPGVRGPQQPRAHLAHALVEGGHVGGPTPVDVLPDPNPRRDTMEGVREMTILPTKGPKGLI